MTAQPRGEKGSFKFLSSRKRVERREEEEAEGKEVSGKARVDMARRGRIRGWVFSTEYGTVQYSKHASYTV